MNLYIYPTDLSWFNFLSARPDIDEINFWQPNGRQKFTRLSTGDLFLFRLKSPVNMIGGGGFFIHSSLVPITAAWEAFAEKNGTAEMLTFVRMISKYRRVTPEETLRDDPQIGCIILTAPFFFRKEAWIPLPSDYSANLVQGKRYDCTVEPGRSLFMQVQAMLSAPVPGMVKESVLSPRVWGDPALVRRRLGQGSFRIVVTDAYDRRCAVTGERTLPVLQAAHIIPVSRGGQHALDNGLLLRSDIHTLFDRGYVTITATRHADHGEFRVSEKLKEEWSNGRVYYALDKQIVRFPDNEDYRPSLVSLEEHNDSIFKK
jgi:putative restriction endonuclease